MNIYHVDFTSCSFYKWSVCTCVGVDGVCVPASKIEPLCVCIYVAAQTVALKKEALIHGDMHGTVLSHSRYI